MNEQSLSQDFESNSERKIKTQQDVEAIQQQLSEQKEQIIEEAPVLYMDAKNAPFCLNVLFDQEGNPKGDFRVSDSYKKKVALAFKRPTHKSSSGEIYWGKRPSVQEYIIMATPTFLTDEELDVLKVHHKLIKRINGIDVELVPPVLQRDNYSNRVEKYMRTIQEPRSRVQKINGILSDLDALKPKLPRGTREVIIDQGYEADNYPGLPHK